MAAQARQYDKGISYSSRQPDDKYMAAKTHLIKSSSSPYRSKPNSNHSSPVGGRKRTHDSPYNNKYGISPYESSKKKDRCNDVLNKSSNDDSYVDSDWSQHISSSGKVYYYNKKTEESQWEVPKDWTNREKKVKDKDRHMSNSSTSSSKDNRNNKTPLDYKTNSEYTRDSSRDYKNSSRENDFRDNKDIRYKESRDYRNRDTKSVKTDIRRDRESYDSRDSPRSIRDFRESNKYDKYDNKYRSPHSNNSSRRSSKYSSSSSNTIKTVGQSTPNSNTSLNRSYHVASPTSLNGSGIVQDISPPGTPTTDDTITNNSLAGSSLFTPSPQLLNNSVLSTTAHLILQSQVGSTPILSPNIVLNTTPQQLPVPYLHPLQQALFIQQQQNQQQKIMSPKDTSYLSPKLPSVKNQRVNDSGATPTSSPTISSLQRQKSNYSNLSPGGSSSRSSTSVTPPPPPPPLKENKLNNSINHHKSESRLSRTSSTPYNKPEALRDSLNRSKSHQEYQEDESPLKPSYKASELRYNEDKSLKKHAERLLHESKLMFTELPDLQRYSNFYSPAFNDFTLGFYGVALDKQADTVLDEAMNIVHRDCYRSKSLLTAVKNDLNVKETKLDVSLNWVGALNNVLSKIESLQDTSMTASTPVSMENKRESKLYAHRKPKTIVEQPTSTAEVLIPVKKQNGSIKVSTNIIANENSVQQQKNGEVR